MQKASLYKLNARSKPLVLPHSLLTPGYLEMSELELCSLGISLIGVLFLSLIYQMQ